MRVWRSAGKCHTLKPGCPWRGRRRTGPQPTRAWQPARAIDSGPAADYLLTMSVVRKRPARSGEVGATEFKARCLELMDRVAATGNPVVITKRGRPVARLVPVQQRPRSIVGALKGHARIRGDIVSPIDIRWEASR